MNVHLYAGPMCAGKTTRLLKEYNNVEGSKLLIKNPISRGSGREILTHDGDHCTASHMYLPKQIDKWDSIFIDEGQFFPDLVEMILEWSKCREPLSVHIACLDMDFRGVKFPLFEKIEEIIFKKQIKGKINILHSICYLCGSEATYSKRISKETSIICVDAVYKPCCTVCYTL